MNKNGGSFSFYNNTNMEGSFRSDANNFYKDTQSIISKMWGIIKNGTSTLGYGKEIFSTEPINRELFNNNNSFNSGFFIKQFSEFSVNIIDLLYKILLNIFRSNNIDTFNANKDKLLEKLKESHDTLSTLNKSLDEIPKYKNTLSKGFNFINGFNSIRQKPVSANTPPINPTETSDSTTTSSESKTTGGKRHRKNQTRRHHNRRKRSQRHY
jgi:hypothetical protein